jgi:uncharacterized membrane protein YeaQ/YmgE (transglycosylase-associated protein family)
MEELNGVTIYWLISIGLLVGFFMDLIIGKRGMGMNGNLIGGVIGSVIIGVAAIYLNLFGALVYAVLGAVAFLFLCNVFNIHPQHNEDTKIA